jgi:hypothetical protein
MSTHDQVLLGKPIELTPRRRAVLLAMAQADGQPWTADQEASGWTDHMAEMMYGADLNNAILLSPPKGNRTPGEALKDLVFCNSMDLTYVIDLAKDAGVPGTEIKHAVESGREQANKRRQTAKEKLQ